MVIMVFMIVGIPIAFVSPTTGEIREKPLILLFYGSIAGMSIIVVYSAYKDRKSRQRADSDAKRRSKRRP